jgi:hypothetical protein
MVVGTVHLRDLRDPAELLGRILYSQEVLSTPRHTHYFVFVCCLNSLQDVDTTVCAYRGCDPPLFAVGRRTWEIWQVMETTITNLAN